MDSLFSATQLVAHVIGDYILQSGWMATQKHKSHWPATVHSFVYGTPFALFFEPSALAMAVIVGTHFAIDRWQLARYVAYAKEFLAPPGTWLTWKECCDTGVSEKTPAYVSRWLLIITDNTMHVVINALALRYL